MTKIINFYYKIMNLKKFSSKYRKNLDNILRKGGVKDFDFLKVKDDLPNSLTIIGLPKKTQMNCHGFTFRKEHGFKPLQVWQLLKQGNLKPLLQPRENCIVLYIDAERKIPIIYHSAVYLKKGYVRSKWSNGPIFDHKIFDCPLSYGNKVKFYKLK